MIVERMTDLAFAWSGRDTCSHTHCPIFSISTRNGHTRCAQIMQSSGALERHMSRDVIRAVAIMTRFEWRKREGRDWWCSTIVHRMLSKDGIFRAQTRSVFRSALRTYDCVGPAESSGMLYMHALSIRECAAGVCCWLVGWANSREVARCAADVRGKCDGRTRHLMQYRRIALALPRYR